MKKIITLILLLAAMTVIVVMTGYYRLTSARNRLATPRRGVVTGVLYNIEKPSAVIDCAIVQEGNIIHGVKVVKIYRDKVEFEKNRKRWTQQVGQWPTLSWPEIHLD